MTDRITGKTQLIGLLGSPVAHSISPAMHNKGFELLNLDYVYLAFDSGEAQLEEAVKGLRALKVRGWNLTMPHKSKMCELVEVLSPASKMMNAVNTVVNENGILTGYNTDGTGYMQMLKEENVDIIGKKITIIGAGGAARAIAVQAALDGVKEMAIFNRHVDKARQLADDINTYTTCSAGSYSVKDTSQLKEALLDSVLLINATQVGMHPKIGESVIEDQTLLHHNLVVSDIIYNPRKTKLLAMAEKQGCKTMNGLQMLLWQGVHGFKLWTGYDMPVEAIKNSYFK
ncbi:MAG: shikimate dehydrogenase [Eubacterium sp.]